MRLFTSLLLALILFSTLNIEASQKRKVLFIGIDGTRADALQQAHTPYIDSLFASPGLSTYNAWCAGITISGPTWSSMLTGVWFNKHGVTNNNYTGSDFNTYPYFTTLAKQLKPNLYCAEVCEWPPLIDDVYNDNFNLRLHVPDGQGATTCATAATVLANDSIDFMFVYFDQVDLTGHSSGFSPTNPAYITAIENVDSCVGVVLDALHNRAHYADEDWLVILMTDHGGIGTGHGGNTDQERQIWWIASGNDLQNYTPTGTDPGTYNSLYVGVFTPNSVDTTILHQTPVHTDVAVTALHHLIYDTGINPGTQPSWNLDGKSWLVDPNSTGIKQVADKPDFKIYPNPASGIVAVYFENDNKYTPYVNIYNTIGQKVNAPYSILSPNKLNIDVSELANGIYTVNIRVGNTEKSEQLVVSK